MRRVWPFHKHWRLQDLFPYGELLRLGEYEDFSEVVGLVAAFGARLEIIFALILVFPACAIEVQHINENSPAIFIGIFAPK